MGREKGVAEVVVVLPEWVHEGLADLEPAHVEEELEDGEDGDEDLDVLLGEDLPAHEADGEVAVRRYGHHLDPEKGEGGRRKEEGKKGWTWV